MSNLVEDLIYQEECYAIMGACFAVYKDKGCGFLEPVYQECLEIEFEHLKLPAVLQPQLAIWRKDIWHCLLETILLKTKGMGGL